MKLAPNEIAAFAAVVNTLLPSVPGEGLAWTAPGVDVDLAVELPKIFERLPNEANRRELKLFLRSLATPAAGVALHGRMKAFTSMTADERQSAFLAMQNHRVPKVRSGAAALKTLAAFLWASTEDQQKTPESWEAMGYPGPREDIPENPVRLQTMSIDRDTTLRCDVVIVGSGAGGGVAAGVLAEAGLDVVVLERGQDHPADSFSHLEADSYNKLYLDRALGTTADGGIQILAGATVGGGTVINYSTSFALPDDVRDEWDDVSGFGDVFTGSDFDESAAAVTVGLGVNRDNGTASERGTVLEKGLRDLGWHVDEMPRNAQGCTEQDCGYCTMGCRLDAKRSTRVTYLRRAVDQGARLIPGAAVETIETEGGRASGVQATVGGYALNVQARAVVVAGGALSTPALLLRSGIGGPDVGKNLRLHPVTVVWGRFERRIDPWLGTLQSRYSDEFADLDGQGYGFRFEEAPVHPLFPAAFVGWEDGQSFKRDILGLGHLSVAGILLRDSGSGRVKIRREGSPVWKYALSEKDRSHIRTGVERGAEMLIASGAEALISSTMSPVRWRAGQSRAHFMAGVDALGYKTNQMRYVSFHQMGSARAGSDPKTSVVDRWNECHDTPGVFVMDGSMFPTASGVNPMLTICAVAHRAATHLASELS